MGLKGKMSCQTEVKCHGGIFHDLFKHKPHEISKYSSEKIHSVELHEGHEYGKVGSVLFWKYTHEGKEKSMKTKVEHVDEEKKLITFVATEGDVFEHYKHFKFTLHVESHHIKKEEKEEHHHHLHLHHHDEKEEHKVEEKFEEHEHMVNWTFEYEKKHEEGPAPTSYVDWALGVTKDVEVHHYNKYKY